MSERTDSIGRRRGESWSEKVAQAYSEGIEAVLVYPNGDGAGGGVLVLRMRTPSAWPFSFKLKTFPLTKDEASALGRKLISIAEGGEGDGQLAFLPESYRG